MTVRDIDRGWKHFVQSVSEFGKFDIIVGWIDGKKSTRNKGDAINNATLALIHEFGTDDGRIPEGRLGFREWQDREQSQIADHVEDAYRQSISGSNVNRELNRVGLWAVSAWRNYQREKQPGPEIGITREKQIVKKHGNKGFLNSKKLVDTGQLVSGITHQVRRRVGR